MNKDRIPHPGVDLLCGIYLEFCNSRLEYLILGSIISFVEFVSYSGRYNLSYLQLNHPLTFCKKLID